MKYSMLLCSFRSHVCKTFCDLISVSQICTACVTRKSVYVPFPAKSKSDRDQKETLTWKHFDYTRWIHSHNTIQSSSSSSHKTCYSCTLVSVLWSSFLILALWMHGLARAKSTNLSGERMEIKKQMEKEQ